MRAKAILVVCFLMAPTLASADFIAYNDLGGSSSGNVTAWTVGSSGLLKNYATGASTGVTVAATGTDTFTDTGTGLSTYAGGEAAAEFNGIVNNVGYVRSNTQSSTSYMDLTFTGLNPNMLYTIVFGADRNGGYTNRTAIFTISDVDAFANASTTGTNFSGPTDPAVWFNTGANNTLGYVARFKDIKSGNDGDMRVRVGLGPDNPNQQWYVNEFKLVEVVPEPAALSFLALGLPLITRRRRQ
jgi:hypothetical protein